MDELEDVSEPGSVRQCGEGRGYLVTRSNPGRRRVATGRSWWRGAADRRLLREMGLGRWRGRRWQKAVSQTTYAHLRAATVAARAGESERSEGGWEGRERNLMCNGVSAPIWGWQRETVGRGRQCSAWLCRSGLARIVTFVVAQ